MARTTDHYHGRTHAENPAMSDADGGYLSRREFDQFARSTRQELHSITASIDGLRADLKGVGRVPASVFIGAGSLALGVTIAGGTLVGFATAARVDPVVAQVRALDNAMDETRVAMGELEERRKHEAALREAPILQRVAALEAGRDRLDERVRGMEQNRHTAEEGRRQDERLAALEVGLAIVTERVKP